MDRDEEIWVRTGGKESVDKQAGGTERDQDDGATQTRAEQGATETQRMTRGPSVRLCRIGRPLRHIAVLRAGEVTLRRSCVWYVGRGVVPLTGRDR